MFKFFVVLFVADKYVHFVIIVRHLSKDVNNYHGHLAKVLFLRH